MTEPLNLLSKIHVWQCLHCILEENNEFLPDSLVKLVWLFVQSSTR